MKKSILVINDLLLISLSLLLATIFVYYPFTYEPFHLLQFFNIVVLQLFTLFVCRVHQAFWKFFSISDLVKLIGSITLSVLIPFILLALFIPDNWYEMITLTANWFVLVVLLSASRIAYRRFSEVKGHTTNRDVFKNTIIIGAGDGGEKLLREIDSNKELPYKIIGFLDDDPTKIGRNLRGIKIINKVNALPEIIAKFSIKVVLVAIPSANDEQMRTILDLCSNSGLEIKTLPNIKYILDGRVQLSQLHEVSPEDLLGREAVNLDMTLMSEMIKDKVVMVTGAGGSIGKELCRQICQFQPKQLILFELTELFLYEIEAELTNKGHIIPIIGDIRNQVQVCKTIEKYKPELIFHAAAYKHVPMMEKNPHEAVKTNIGGTRIVAKAADQYGVKKFILISTDKAINPTNVMGATKRVAEMIGQEIQKQSKTQFITIRFGNVLGSSGSVIPLFKKQIASGGPLTVTHPEIKRYFMSISEASQLVIQAATFGKGGEIFILDMGDPIKIVDLARQMITASGLIENRDIKIEFVGLRPGEKLYEELLYKDEEVLATNHIKVKVAKLSTPSNPQFDESIEELISSQDDDVQIKLKKIVPEYIPGVNS